MPEIFADAISTNIQKGKTMSDRITNWTRSDDAAVEQAIRRGATRRELLHMMLAGGVALSAGSAILGRASQAVAATPVSGGTLKAAGWSASTADTLDPAKASLSTDYVRCCALYNRLSFLDISGTPQMELAESIETKDAKTWTVKLRSGVTFHDGKALTADDVVYSLKRHLDPAVGSKVAKIAAQMTGFKALDKSTVEITLANANADLPAILALHHFMIVADGTTDFSKGNGTGAFKLEKFEPGVRSVMAKNANYWKSVAHTSTASSSSRSPKTMPASTHSFRAISTLRQPSIHVRYACSTSRRVSFCPRARPATIPTSTCGWTRHRQQCRFRRRHEVDRQSRADRQGGSAWSR